MSLLESIRSNRRNLARLLTRIENGDADSILAELYPHTGHAQIIGITGAPGTGKSSLVSALTKHYRGQNRRVAILAIDPTSPFSGGAILGDRIRMHDLAGDPGVFIRSVASRGVLGGLSRKTPDLIRVFDAAGFDMILIETVGAGQGEVEIARTAPTTIVVEAPGLGDEVQAIKAGILEIADILVVNKADNPAADNTVRALRAMLDLGHPITRHHGQAIITAQEAITNSTWLPPIIKTIAIQNQGIPELAEAIQTHRDYLGESGTFARREREHLHDEIINRLREALLTRLLSQLEPTRIAILIDQIERREIDPAQAVQQLLDEKG